MSQFLFLFKIWLYKQKNLTDVIKSGSLSIVGNVLTKGAFRFILFASISNALDIDIIQPTRHYFKIYCISYMYVAYACAQFRGN